MVVLFTAVAQAYMCMHTLQSHTLRHIVDSDCPICSGTHLMIKSNGVA